MLPEQIENFLMNFIVYSMRGQMKPSTSFGNPRRKGLPRSPFRLYGLTVSESD